MFDKKLNVEYRTFNDKKMFKNVKNIIITSTKTNIVLINGENFVAEYTGECLSENNPVIHYNVTRNILELSVDLDGHVKNSSFVIIVPKDINIISISTITGCIFADILNADNLKITTTIGNIEGNYNARQIDLNTTSGNIKLSSNAEWLNVNTSSGYIELNLNECLKNVKAESVSGDIKINSLNKNIHLNFNTLGGKLVSKIQDNRNSNIVFDVNTIIGNVFIS